MTVQSRIGGLAAVLLALAASASLSPSPAVAQDGPVTIYGEVANTRTEFVSFARMDLGNARDQRRLRSRVAAAVERVCLREIGRDGLQDRGYYACEEKALDDAAPQIATAIAGAGNLAMAPVAPIAAIRVRAL